MIGHRRALGSLCCAIALLTAGCSGGGSEAEGPTDGGDGGVTTTLATSMPEPFAGTVDEFYVVPEDLPEGAPGEVIRIQALSNDAAVVDESGYDGPDALTVSWRIMYHSRDAAGNDRAVTGVITYPTTEAPEGGWSVVTTAHGTTGIAPVCAPSRWLTAAPAQGVHGVRVATDYIGLGPVGQLHPYLSGLDEGHSVLDAVRAARNLPDANAGSDYLTVGHSQGGHAALWAHQLGPGYAPELDPLGTVALAPAAELTETYGPVDEIVANVVSVMALYGAAANDPTIVPDDYVGDEVAAQADVITGSCLDEITTAFVPIPADEFYDARPQDTEPARSMILASDPGNVAVDTPLLLVQGDEDIRVHPRRTTDLFERLCLAEQLTDYHLYIGTDHDSVLGASQPMVEDWLHDRLVGAEPAGSCDPDEPEVHE